jgi:hypothetical protein
VSAYDAGNSLTGRSRVAMLGGYGVYDNHGWEAIAEYYHFRNTNLSSTGTSHGSWAGYAQLGHAFQERWVPYYRFEKAELDPSDTYFLSLANGRSYSRHVLGLRFNAEARAALKFELNSTRDQGLGRTLDELRLQYAVSF